MRSNCKRVWLAAVAQVIILTATLSSALANPLSGTLAVGPGGDYPSITAAIADIQLQTLGGPLVLELQPNYVSSVETFPIVFNNLTTTAANTLTLRPQSGATGLLIAGPSSPVPTIDLSGAQYVTIDGRPGGSGSNAGSGVGAASQLTISDAGASGMALRLVNGACGNTIVYVTLKGVNSSISGGVVLFSLGGNTNNTIDHCDIRDGATTPANGVYCSSSANAGNTIANCNIYNFAAGVGNQYGILLNGGTDWTITGNSFYQTVPRSNASGLGQLVGAININSPSGSNIVVMSNSIGGSGPGASGTWMITGTIGDTRFVGMTLNAGSVSVQGNTIKNFSWLTSNNSSTLPGIWGGITVSGGSANITGNVIGDTGFYSISITTSGVRGLASGISSTGTNTVVIASNTVTSMEVAGTVAAIVPSLTAIGITAGPDIIRNNTVGTQGNFSAMLLPAATGTGQQLTGIFSSSTNNVTISGNLVTGLNNQYNGSTGGQVRGILVSDGVNTVTGNTVNNLTTATGYGGGQSLVSALGISVTSSLPGQTISQNIVSLIAATSATAAVYLSGIDFNGAAGADSMLDRNLVYSLVVNSTNLSSQVRGFAFSSGSFTMQNNMVCVGVGANGSSTANASLVFGIYDGGSDPNRNFYHNSIYLGGTAPNSFATHYTVACFSGGASNARTYKNNIFVNARSRSGGTSAHYAFYNFGSDLTGLTSNGNLFQAAGTGGVMARYNSTSYANLTDWQTASGQDAASLVADPLFVNSASDLHISSGSPAINAGLLLDVPTDFDGDPRSLTTPTIGADELFDYTLVPGYNQLSAQWLGGGTNTLGFHGVPNSGYALEMATNLTPPVFWQPVTTNVTGTKGAVSFTNIPSQSPVFYRTRFVP